MHRRVIFSKVCSSILAGLLCTQFIIIPAKTAFATQGDEVLQKESADAQTIQDMSTSAENIESNRLDSGEIPPVPGADARVSPTDKSTHLEMSASDFLSEGEVEAAHSRTMQRSASDYSNATFADILFFAEKYLGVPYVWGGKDPSRDGGFDCSGYVSWVYNQICGLGINSDYTNAASLYANWCSPIPESEAQPGDIVFFTGTYGSNMDYITHVGIYCGNGVMINAGDPIGYDSVAAVKNVQGVEAGRVYGRLVTLRNTSADFGLAQVQVADQLYTGSPLVPHPTVIVAGYVLRENVDYSLSYKNNIQVGQAEVTITGIGAYAGQVIVRPFDIFNSGAIESGTYFICSQLPSGRVVDVPNGSSASGIGIHLFTLNRSDAQIFQISEQSDGYYTIENDKSGKYLTASDSEWDLRTGTEITQESYQSGSMSQKWIIKASGDGFSIASAVNSSLVFDVEDGSDIDGSSVRLWDANGTSAQTWNFDRAQGIRDRLDALAKDNAETIADGSYQISSGVDDKFSLDVYGGSADDLANVWLYSSNGTPAQTWRVSHDQAGYLTIVNEGSGKALDVYGGYGVPGANVDQYTPNGSWAQKWVAVKQGAGYKIVSALDDSLVLDLFDGQAVNRNNVWLYSSNGTSAQTWNFDRAQGIRDRLDALAKDNAETIADGSYQISSGVDDKFSLDVYGGSADDLANVWLYSSNGTPAQTWRVSHDQAGYLTIVNEGSGKALDVYGGYGVPGANVDQYTPNGSWAQKWVAVKQGAGYKIVSALDDSLVLDLFDGQAVNRNNVWLYSSNGTSAQTWNFDRAQGIRDRLDALAKDNAETIADGSYQISSGVDDKFSLDVYGGSADDLANVWLYSSNGTPAQTWRVSHDQAGYLTIVNEGSGKALDVYGGYGVPGANVDQYTPNGSWAQKWVAVKQGAGYKIVSALDDSLVLDLFDGQAVNRNNVWLYSSNGTSAQTWNFDRAQGIRDRLDALAKDNAETIADGSYQISSGVDDKFSLDVYGGSADDLANVWLYSSNGTPAQTWRVSHDQAGYLTIVNEGSGKALDVYGGYGVPGANVDQYTPNGSWAQKWVAVKQGAGYKIVSALDDSLVLDLFDGQAVNRNNVWLYSSNGTSAQTWNFVMPGGQEVVPSGYYTIHTALNPVYQLDVYDASLGDGAKVWLYEGNGTLAQLFKLEWTAGYYTITNANSGKNLRVVSSGELQQSAKLESDAARFVIRVNEDGTYTLLNRETRGAVTVVSGIANAAGAVGDAENTNTVSQRWLLKKSASNVQSQHLGITLEQMAALNQVSSDILDPDLVKYGTRAFYQFADLRKYQGDITVEQMDAFISSTESGRKGVFAGKGAAVLAAARKADINEMYLISHMITETGWGTSPMASGRYYDAGIAMIKLNGQYFTKEVPAGRYYNFIGWGAYDSMPDTAYDFARYYGWDTIEDALYGAAQQLSRYYIYNGQNTLYAMRWNPVYADKYGVISHQYASDPNWADTIGTVMGQGYDYVGFVPGLDFFVPQYA